MALPRQRGIANACSMHLHPCSTNCSGGFVTDCKSVLNCTYQLRNRVGKCRVAVVGLRIRNFFLQGSGLGDSNDYAEILHRRWACFHQHQASNKRQPRQSTSWQLTQHVASVPNDGSTYTMMTATSGTHVYRTTSSGTLQANRNRGSVRATSAVATLPTKIWK
jgi:hypothetical protein